MPPNRKRKATEDDSSVSSKKPRIDTTSSNIVKESEPTTTGLVVNVTPSIEALNVPSSISAVNSECFPQQENDKNLQKGRQRCSRLSQQQRNGKQNYSDALIRTILARQLREQAVLSDDSAIPVPQKAHCISPRNVKEDLEKDMGGERAPTIAACSNNALGLELHTEKQSISGDRDETHSYGSFNYTSSESVTYTRTRYILIFLALFFMSFLAMTCIDLERLDLSPVNVKIPDFLRASYNIVSDRWPQIFQKGQIPEEPSKQTVSNEINETITHLQRELHVLQREKQVLLQHFHDANRKVDTAKNAHDKLSHDLLKTTQDFVACQKKIENVVDLEQAVGMLEADLAECNKQTSHQSGLLSVAEKEREEMESIIKDLAAKEKVLNKEVELLHARHESLAEELSSASSEYKEQQYILEELQLELEQTRLLNFEQKMHLFGFEQQVIRNASELSEKEQILESLQAEVRESEERVSSSKAKEELMSKALTTADEFASEQGEIIEALRRRQYAMQQELEKMKTAQERMLHESFGAMNAIASIGVKESRRVIDVQKESAERQKQLMEETMKAIAAVATAKCP